MYEYKRRPPRGLAGPRPPPTAVVVGLVWSLVLTPPRPHTHQRHVCDLSPVHTAQNRHTCRITSHTHNRHHFACLKSGEGEIHRGNYRIREWDFDGQTAFNSNMYFCTYLLIPSRNEH